MVDESDQEFISVREAARECGKNAETVRRWIWSGKLPARKLGNQLFIKRGDFASFCRETAVKYRAELEANFLEKAKAIRERIHARTGKTFDAAEEIRQMREERMNEIERRMRISAAGNYETGSEKREDFIERAIRFRNKLRARGYPEVDTVALVKKSREGRMRELRQSLR